MADPFWERPPDADPQKDKKTQLSRRRVWTVRILTTIAALLVLGLVSLTAIVVIGYQTTKEPNPNKDFQTSTTFVYYNDGKTELGTFEVQNRQPLTYEEMPEDIKQAVVAAENRSRSAGRRERPHPSRRPSARCRAGSRPCSRSIPSRSR